MIQHDVTLRQYNERVSSVVAALDALDSRPSSPFPFFPSMSHTPHSLGSTVLGCGVVHEFVQRELGDYAETDSLAYIPRLSPPPSSSSVGFGFSWEIIVNWEFASAFEDDFWERGGCEVVPLDYGHISGHSPYASFKTLFDIDDLPTYKNDKPCVLPGGIKHNPVSERFGDTYGLASFLPGGIRVKAVRLSHQNSSGGGRRGKVVGQSKSSSRRMVQKMMTVPWSEFAASGKGAKRGRGFFLTLTYPGDWSTFDNWQDWKGHLAAFRKRLFRAYPDLIACIWKLEFQKRGAPHFHLVLLFDSAHTRLKVQRRCRSMWADILSADDGGNHGRHGAKLETMYGEGSGLMAYLSKYMTKGDYIPEQYAESGTGRIWGVWGKLPSHYVARVSFHSRDDWFTFIRRVRSWGRCKSRYLAKFKSGMVFGVGAALADLLRGLVVNVSGLDGCPVPGRMYFEWV
jgi:hypothetical protein